MAVPTAIFIVAVLLNIGNLCGSDEVKALSQNAEPGEYPFLVTFNIRGNMHMPCAGSLITDRWVLTTASCIIDPKFKYFNFVSAGRSNDYANQAWEEKIRVNDTRLFTHDKFNPISFENDIGLILLPRSLKTSKYLAPVDLIEKGHYLENDAQFQIVGWGDLSLGDLGYSGAKYSTVLVRDNKACRSHVSQSNCPDYSAFDKKLDTIICSTSDVPMDISLSGYSHIFGGPLISRKPDGSLQQVGITSWTSKLGKFSAGTQCTNETAIIAYTNLAIYSDWIEDIFHNSASFSQMSIVLLISCLFASMYY